MKIILIFSTILILTILGLDFFTKSGIFWSIDSIFYPIENFKSFFSQSIYWHLRDFINIYFGYQFYAKFLLLGTLLVGVFLGYKISKLVFKIFDIKETKIKEALSVLSISFLLVNPFIYERLVTQIGIALAIYLIGLGLVYLIEYLLNKIVATSLPQGRDGERGLYFSSLFFGLALTIMPHTAVFVSIIVIITLAFFWKKFEFKNIFISILIFLFININWIIGNLFLGEKNSISKVGNFNELNIEAFTTNKLYGSVEFTNMLLYGFWPEKYNNRLLKPETDWWVVAGILIFSVIVYGFIKLYKKQKKLSLYLLSLGLVAFILGTSISSSLFGWISELFYNYIPYYIGMREPEKLTGLLMIVYAIFFIIGIYFLFENFSSFRKKEVFKKYFLNKYAISIYSFILLIIWSPNVLFGFNSWLKITDYPKEIFASKEYLKEKKLDNILILPWHSYTACLWTDGKVIANPIQYILSPIKNISADNIEIEKLYSNSQSKRSKKISEFIKTHNFEILKNLKIDTIYFTDYCADYPKYDFLKKSESLKLKFNSKYIKIYNIK